MYGYGEEVTALCGCVIEVVLETDYGCCDEYCTPTSYMESAKITSTCEAHTVDRP